MADSEHYKKFGALNVILADENPGRAQKTRELLSSLGVYQLRIAHNYQQMLEMMQKTPADLIAFDAGAKTMREIEFIQRLRNEKSQFAMTPILSLSADTTAQDVRNLVDAGTDDLLAKPANVKSLYSRIQRMVDSPRSFIATRHFKGPDRRRKPQDKAYENRVKKAPRLVSVEEFLAGDFDEPVMIAPDFNLKIKVNHLTDGMLRPAIEDEFVFWSISDISAMEACLNALISGSPSAPHIERICSACLSVEARSAAYGYDLGCEISRKLGEFCRHHFQEGRPGHITIIEKHIQTLSVVYHHRLRGNGGEQGQELIRDIGKLVGKYA